MAKIVLLILSCITFCNGLNNTKFCVVNLTDPGIAVIDLKKGKDGTYAGSVQSMYTADLEIIRINKYSPGSWQNISSLENNNSFKNRFIKDHRWENLLNNHDNPNSIHEKMYDHFSIRLFENFQNLDIPTGKWQNLKISNSQYYKCENDNCTKIHTTLTIKDMYEKTSVQKAIWKAHNYFYIYTQEIDPKSEFVFTKTTNCIHLEKACITMYLAGCKSCTFTIMKDNVKTVAKFKGRETWEMKSISLDNFSSCFNLSIKLNFTRKKENWWSLGDYIQLLNNTCCEIKRYIPFNNTKNMTCENSLGLKFEPESGDFLQKIETATKMKPTTTTTSSGFNFYLCFLLLFIPVIAYAVYYFIYKRKSTQNTQIEELVLLSSQDDVITSMPSIKAADFSNYVLRMCQQNSNCLEKQFNSISKEYLREANEGRKEENLEKNRYKNYFPYDDNRVILLKNDKMSSDYINASYVEGVNNSKEYILSQNPMKNTIDDFFTMIWQEGIEHIVMISAEADNYIHYWSHNKTFNNTTVRLIQSTNHAFYTRRVIEITRDKESRTLNQLHLFSWTTDIICSYIFIDFVNELLKIPHSTAPVLFHCLAGIGRSGTIVLCDIALRSARSSGTYNIFELLKQLRFFRVEIVPNLKQYKLAHLIIYESINCIETSVDICEDFDSDFIRLTEGNSAKKLWLQSLEHTAWLYEAITPYIPCIEYPKLNRYVDPTLLPVEHSRVLLDTKIPDYIHAMYVNNYLQEQKYIVAQQPLPGTLSNFWLMVIQNKVELIVNLNVLDLHIRGDVCYYPTQTSFIETEDNITVKLINQEKNSTFDELHADIHLYGKYYYSICILVVRGWQKIKHVPESTDVVTSIWKASELYRNRNSKILFCCEDGITSSGLMVAFFYTADRMLLEKKCDIIGAIRAIRRTHTKFVNFDQYVFLHNCALAFFKNYMTKIK